MKSRSRFTKLASVIAVMLVAVFMLSACNGKDKDKVKLIDFTAYTQYDIVDWSLANKVQDKINYLFECSETVPENYFIRSSLEVGSVIDKEFDVVISLGSEKESTPSQLMGLFTMPNVIGLSVDEAKETIAKAGILSKIEIVDVLSTLPKDTVLQSRPGPDFYLGASPEDTKNTDILLIVSSGNPLDKTVDITLDLDHKLSSVSLLKVYVNDVLTYTFSETSFKNPDATSFDFSVRGTGFADVRVEEIHRSSDYNFSFIQSYYFSVDFVNGTYIKVKDPYNPFNPYYPNEQRVPNWPRG